MDDSKLRAVRNEALEEAAKAAEEIDVSTFTYCQVLHDDGALTKCEIVAAIRALKDQPGLIPAAPRAWVGLADTQWMNIVYHDHAYRAYSKDGAVLLAIKMTEAKLKELNTAPITAADHQEMGRAQDKIDAERYRWLRMRDWFDGPLCVLRNPKKVLTEGRGLGADCPSRDRLDNAIDLAILATKEGAK